MNKHNLKQIYEKVLSNQTDEQKKIILNFFIQVALTIVASEIETKLINQELKKLKVKLKVGK